MRSEHSKRAHRLAIVLACAATPVIYARFGLAADGSNAGSPTYPIYGTASGGDATPTFGDGGSAWAYGDSTTPAYAAGGSGYGGGGGGNATATVTADPVADSYSADHGAVSVWAQGGSPGNGSGPGTQGGNGGSASATGTAEASATSDGVDLSVTALGAGGGNGGGDSGSAGASANATSDWGGNVTVDLVARTVDGGGSNTDGSSGGNGASVSLTNAATGSISANPMGGGFPVGSLTLSESATAGSGGGGDGAGGSGGDASAIMNNASGDVTTFALAGTGGNSDNGTPGTSGTATAYTSTSGSASATATSGSGGTGPTGTSAASATATAITSGDENATATASGGAGGFSTGGNGTLGGNATATAQTTAGGNDISANATGGYGGDGFNAPGGNGGNATATAEAMYGANLSAIAQGGGGGGGNIGGSGGSAKAVIIAGVMTLQETADGDPPNAANAGPGGPGAGGYASLTYGSGSLTASGGGSLTITNAGSACLSLNVAPYTPSGSTLSIGSDIQLPYNSGETILNGLTIDDGCTFDVTNNHVIIDYDCMGNTSDPAATIYGYIQSGFNNGNWNGSGIISSTAQLPTNGFRYGVGWADGADGVVSGISSGQIEIKYTLLGDANLDGTVNGSDFSILAANFGLGVTNWDQGNFLYSSSVNGSDFSALAANFGQGDNGADTLVSPADLAALDAFAAANGLPMPTVGAVPEPSSISALSVLTFTLLRRNRKTRILQHHPEKK